MTKQYTKAEKAEWGRQQDIARAARAAQAAQGIAAPKATPAKRASRAKALIADTSDSVCFDDLRYRDGIVTATFAKGGGAGTYEYECSLAQAREWFDDDLGAYFNENIR